MVDTGVVSGKTSHLLTSPFSQYQAHKSPWRRVVVTLAVATVPPSSRIDMSRRRRISPQQLQILPRLHVAGIIRKDLVQHALSGGMVAVLA
jgi:hypothetical protein